MRRMKLKFSSMCLLSRLRILATIAFAFCIVVGNLKCSYALNIVEEYLTLSQPQKWKLDEFRERVSPRLPEDYMKKEVYLIRFLRENDFDVQAAEKMIMKNLQWRKDRKIDSLVEKNWTRFNEEYDPNFEGCDFDGQPVGSFALGDWDIRREVIVSGGEKFLQYMDKSFEELFQMAVKMQDDGQNVTHASVIVDVNGFNLISHACPACIAVYINMVISFQANYPGFARRIIGVNTPSYAIPLWNTYKYVVSPKLRNTVKIFGTNKKEWQKYLLQEIPASQLSKRFGGTKEDLISMNDLRKSGKVFRCSREFWEYFE